MLRPGTDDQDQDQDQELRIVHTCTYAHASDLPAQSMALSASQPPLSPHWLHSKQRSVASKGPESLARTQKQVQSSTADLPGSWSPPALILLVPNLLSWGRAKGLVRASSQSQKAVVGPLPLATAAEVYGVGSVPAEL
ncbi:uncharacterized protein TrAFT101_003497 [Trichoderma asperellum]|uniref:uncharacterized protein n=1 Tax=Trichoderma asperellum TaxID=101201 RepID=UPI00332904EF|nr:hypothetical protein TrAFT101_003497 [Trichoderma asperellum]